MEKEAKDSSGAKLVFHLLWRKKEIKKLKTTFTRLNTESRRRRGEPVGTLRIRVAGSRSPPRMPGRGSFLVVPQVRFQSGQKVFFKLLTLARLDWKQWRKGRQLFLCCFFKSQDLFLSPSGSRFLGAKCEVLHNEPGTCALRFPPRPPEGRDFLK